MQIKRKKIKKLCYW